MQPFFGSRQGFALIRCFNQGPCGSSHLYVKYMRELLKFYCFSLKPFLIETFLPEYNPNTGRIHLFIPQRLNRIQFCRLVGRIDSKEYPDSSRKQPSNENDLNIYRRWNFNEIGDNGGKNNA